MKFESTKIIELGSCAFRQWKADSHCKFIHGYRLIGKFWFECNILDERNWVVDFGGLKNLKQVLEKQFDHTLCIAGDDPLLNYFQQLHQLGAVDLRIMPKGVGIERTAEFCFEIADSHVRGITNNRCWVSKVEVWEHDKNSAIVSYLPTVVEVQNNNVFSTSIQSQVSPVAEFLNEVKEESGIDLQTVIKNAPEQTAAPGPRPAHVGRSNVTSGYSNLFGGTSWGT
jgi:6-pyruvoyltetrahydropterin/6-carboxytetrahydropterin synthase